VRWILVFLFYAAAELMSPAAAAPHEALDGEAEESIHIAGQRRILLPAVTRPRSTTAMVRRTAQVRAPRPRAVRGLATARSAPVRKAVPVIAGSASASEDH
jgi:hypothetical protein